MGMISVPIILALLFIFLIVSGLFMLDRSKRPSQLDEQAKWREKNRASKPKKAA